MDENQEVKEELLNKIENIIKKINDNIISFRSYSYNDYALLLDKVLSAIELSAKDITNHLKLMNKNYSFDLDSKEYEQLKTYQDYHSFITFLYTQIKNLKNDYFHEFIHDLSKNALKENIYNNNFNIKENKNFQSLFKKNDNNNYSNKIDVSFFIDNTSFNNYFSNSNKEILFDMFSEYKLYHLNMSKQIELSIQNEINKAIDFNKNLIKKTNIEDIKKHQFSKYIPYLNDYAFFIAPYIPVLQENNKIGYINNNIDQINIISNNNILFNLLLFPEINYYHNKLKYSYDSEYYISTIINPSNVLNNKVKITTDYPLYNIINQFYTKEYIYKFFEEKMEEVLYNKESNHTKYIDSLGHDYFYNKEKIMQEKNSALFVSNMLNYIHAYSNDFYNNIDYEDENYNEQKKNFLIDNSNEIYNIFEKIYLKNNKEITCNMLPLLCMKVIKNNVNVNDEELLSYRIYKLLYEDYKRKNNNVKDKKTVLKSLSMSFNNAETDFLITNLVNKMPFSDFENQINEIINNNDYFNPYPLFESLLLDKLNFNEIITINFDKLNTLSKYVIYDKNCNESIIFAFLHYISNKKNEFNIEYMKNSDIFVEDVILSYLKQKNKEIKNVNQYFDTAYFDCTEENVLTKKDIKELILKLFQYLPNTYYYQRNFLTSLNDQYNKFSKEINYISEKKKRNLYKSHLKGKLNNFLYSTKKIFQYKKEIPLLENQDAKKIELNNLNTENVTEDKSSMVFNNNIKILYSFNDKDLNTNYINLIKQKELILNNKDYSAYLSRIDITTIINLYETLELSIKYANKLYAISNEKEKEELLADIKNKLNDVNIYLNDKVSIIKNDIKNKFNESLISIDHKIDKTKL